MRKLVSCLILCAALLTNSCNKRAASTTPDQTSISNETLARIAALGFSNQNVHKTDAGYLVEGDIVLTDELLNSTPDQKLMRIANTEQYRTTNLVSGLPRVIRIRVTNLGSAFVAG